MCTSTWRMCVLWRTHRVWRFPAPCLPFPTPGERSSRACAVLQRLGALSCPLRVERALTGNGDFDLNIEILDPLRDSPSPPLDTPERKK